MAEVAVANHKDLEHREEVNGIVYKIAKTKKELDEVRDFFFHVFMPDEPFCTAMGMDLSVDMTPILVATLEAFIADGVTVIAVDPKDNDRIIGIRVSFTETKDSLKPPEDLQSLKEKYGEKFSLMFLLMGEWASPQEMFDKHFPESKKMVDFVALAVRREYRKRGIATELVKQAFKVAAKSDCDFAVVIASNRNSRRIFDNLRMTEILRVKREELEVREEFKNKFVKPEALEMGTVHIMKIDKN